MCYYVEQKATIKEIASRFNWPIDYEKNLFEGDFISGFTYPKLPIITNDKPEIITTNFNWGLFPTWCKDLDFRKKTLNARIETIDEKPSYKNITNNRCLIIGTSFYEWRWLDKKGKVKEKYQINSQDDEIICFAGLYNNGTNPLNGEPLNTFTMVTTKANDMMAYVHNHKKRMPIILKKEDENNWLDSNNEIKDFAYPNYRPNLIAIKTQ